MPVEPTAMTSAEVAQIRRMLDIPNREDEVDTLVTRINLLNTDEVTLTRDAITAFKALGKSTVKVKGGTKGADVDFDRDRQAIANEVRLSLGYEVVTDTVLDDTSAIVMGSIDIGGW